jgi:hypothetical protein
MNDAHDYVVGFGLAARTLDYRDDGGELLFTFGFGNKCKNHVYLELSDDTDRTSSESRYDLAV